MGKWTVRVLVTIILMVSPLLASDKMSPFSLGESFGFSSDDSGTGAYLGVDIGEVTQERVSVLKLKEEDGVEVLLVDQDSPAGKAGLKEHDVILTLNGTTVESGAQLRRMIHETPAGRSVTLGISRDGQLQTIKAQLADRRKAMNWKEGDLVNPPEPPEPPASWFPQIEIPNIVVVHSSMRSGLMLENLTPQLGEFFGAKNGKGVLVRSVEKGSGAAKAGLRAGDVIVSVNGEAVSDVGDFSHALRSHKSGNASVSVIRDKREQTISLPIPEKKQSEMQEESWEVPELDADIDIDLTEMTTNIAKLEPAFELAARNAGQAVRQAMETTRKSLCEQKAQMKQQMKQQSEQLSRQMKKLQRPSRDIEVLEMKEPIVEREMI